MAEVEQSLWPHHGHPCSIMAVSGHLVLDQVQRQSGPHRRRQWKGLTLARWLLVVVGLVVLGTLLVLSTFKYYFGVYQSDMIDPSQLAHYLHLSKSVHQVDQWPSPKIPRIIHQTWINDTLPSGWVPARQSCELLHPSRGPNNTWEYMLWTDEANREFIASKYSWFLPHFDGYKYPIQRADAIRYFVLHHYGGVYLDLDIGCKKPMDPLLYFDFIVPTTIPVGVSNDLIFSTPKHPFLDLVIRQLSTFDHNYGTNYPTVMFSTGPMMLSAVYGMWKRHHANDPVLSSSLQVLPRSLYGKHSPPELQAYAYFTHYYGSSWHSDDSGFILWLGRSGKSVLYMLIVVAVVGLYRELHTRRPTPPMVARWKRAALHALSPKLCSRDDDESGYDSAQFPFKLEGWARGPSSMTQLEGNRARRLKRGDLFL